MKTKILKTQKARRGTKILAGIFLVSFLALLGASCGDDEDDSVAATGLSADNAAAENTPTTRSEQPADTQAPEEESVRQSSDSMGPCAETAPSLAPAPDPDELADLQIIIKDGNIAVSSDSDSDFVYDLGDVIIIRVDSDIDGEVHIHGYDDSFYISDHGNGDVGCDGDKYGAGQGDTRYELNTHIAGEFKIELEESQREIVTIEIK